MTECLGSVLELNVSVPSLGMLYSYIPNGPIYLNPRACWRPFLSPTCFRDWRSSNWSRIPCTAGKSFQLWVWSSLVWYSPLQASLSLFLTWLGIASQTLSWDTVRTALRRTWARWRQRDSCMPLPPWPRRRVKGKLWTIVERDEGNEEYLRTRRIEDWLTNFDKHAFVFNTDRLSRYLNHINIYMRWRRRSAGVVISKRIVYFWNRMFREWWGASLLFSNGGKRKWRINNCRQT